MYKSISSCAGKALRFSVILSGILVLIGCSSADNAPPPPNVKVTQVVQRDVTLYEDFVGQTYGYADIAIRARVDGFLEGIFFREGMPVQKGDLLYTIDPQPYDAKVAEAMGRVAEAKTRLVQAKNDLERYRPLAEINAISQKDLDAAEANYGAALAAVDAAEAALQSAKIQRGYTRIYAPISGVIGKSQAKVGDYVGRDPNSVVLNAISRIDTILVEFFLPESKYLELMRYVTVYQDATKRDDEERVPLELIFSDGTVHTEKGRINFLNRQVDANTGSILVQAKFPNSGGLIRPGQFARVRGPVDILKNAMLIPQKSITELQGQYSVFVVNDSSQAAFRSIITGPAVDDMSIVTEGLEPNDQVIYEGLLKARSGQTVSVIQEPFESVNPKNNQ